MEKIVVANLKMNLTLKDISEYLKKIEFINDKNFIVCPTAIYIPYFLNKKYQVGIQNCFYEKAGAYTGETSPYQIKSLGINYVIIGHSERRSYFNEDDVVLKRKVGEALNANLKIIFCIGETLSEREMMKTLTVLKRQINNVLKEVDLKNIVIAYEPVWAIGTGKEASEKDIIEAVAYIKKIIDVKVLYGGSVNEKNIDKLNDINNVDGFLVGSASNDADAIINILKKVRQ